jgi:hypothetical protein
MPKILPFLYNFTQRTLLYVNSSELCVHVQSFWMDNQTGKAQNKEAIALDGNSVPLYDRGYALGLTLAGGSSNQEG